MTEKTLHIVQQFEKAGKRIVAGRSMELGSAADAIARAERDAIRVPGVVAVSTTVDTETGEVLEEPTILFRHGQLPAELQEA